MGILLIPRNPSEHQVGNVIIYGGATKFYHNFDKDKVVPKIVPPTQVYFVETDFGNHMTMLWSEIETLWITAGWRDYTEWRSKRDELRSQPNLIEKEI